MTPEEMESKKRNINQIIINPQELKVT